MSWKTSENGLENLPCINLSNFFKSGLQLTLDEAENNTIHVCILLFLHNFNKGALYGQE